MKITTFETFREDGTKILGNDCVSEVKDMNTNRKLENAIARHFAKLKKLEDVHPELKGNIKVKYTSKHV